MVCNVTFNPHPFKIARFIQCETSQKFIVECRDFLEAPVVPVPPGQSLQDTPSFAIYRPFNGQYHAQHLTTGSFVAMFTMLHKLNTHSSLESLMPRHQWQMQLVHIPDYQASDRGKNCHQYMDRRYGIENCTGHELEGTLE
ncbi:hypothetical protein TWF281_011685 [Arthrobotrys megalospora]